MATFLSAFLDALTVTAVVITVASGFYAVYHKIASGRGFDDDHDHSTDELVHDPRKGDLEQFRAFLRGLRGQGQGQGRLSLLQRVAWVKRIETRGE